MKELKSKKIEELIQKYKSNLDLEKYVKQELGSALCFVLYKTNVGNVFNDYHHHDLYEILYIVEGKVIYSVEESKYELNAGDMVIMSPTTLHKLDKIVSNTSKRIILTFSEKYAKSLSTEHCDILKCFEIANQKKSHKLSFETTIRKNIERYLSIMESIQFSKQYGDDLTYDLRFCQTMLIINKEIMSMRDENLVLHTPNKKIINEIVEYINGNITKKILISNIAQKLSLSSSRLSHIFKEETGVSILQFIIKKRLILAKELIRKGEHLNVIFGLCGFQDNTSFFRAFKKEYDITPKKYLLNYRASFD